MEGDQAFYSPKTMVAPLCFNTAWQHGMESSNRQRITTVPSKSQSSVSRQSTPRSYIIKKIL